MANTQNKLTKITWLKPKKTCSNCSHFFQENDDIIGRCTVIGIFCSAGECIVDSIENFKKVGLKYSYPAVNRNFGCIRWEEDK